MHVVWAEHMTLGGNFYHKGFTVLKSDNGFNLVQLQRLSLPSASLTPIDLERFHKDLLNQHTNEASEF